MNDLQAVLANYRLEFKTTQIEPLGPAGGMSGAQIRHLTASSVHGPNDPTQFALRRWPAEHPSPERLRWIHAVLRHAANAGITFLPVPATTFAGDSFVERGGFLWQLEPWMPGTADFRHAPSLEKLRAALTALAEFHNATADFQPAPPDSTPAPAPHRHYARLRELTSHNIELLARSIQDSWWPDLAPIARQFVASLPHAIPPALAALAPLTHVNFAVQPCVRDIWHDHVLFTGNSVTGLVDFGALDLDTPATDLTRLISSLAESQIPLPCSDGAGNGSVVSIDEDVTRIFAESLKAYETIRPLAPHEEQAVHALRKSSPILAGCNWLRWIYIERRQFNEQPAIIERFKKAVAAVGPK